MNFFVLTTILALLATSALGTDAALEPRDIATTYTTITYCVDPVWKTKTTTARVPGKTVTVDLPYTSTETDLYYSFSGIPGAWPASYNPATDSYTTSTYVQPVYHCTATDHRNTATKIITRTVAVPTMTATITQWAASTTVATTSVLTNF